MGAYIWILSLVILVFSWWLLAGIQDKAELPSELASVSSCLLVTAHPDDECMFFAPTLLSLRRAGVRVTLLCLSEGNYDGLGAIRREELKRSALLLGIPADRVSVLNDPYDFL
jgi:N-acetylglucosaminylphosphatidylinositol deacetylase